MSTMLSKSTKARIKDGFNYYVAEEGDLEGFCNRIMQSEIVAREKMIEAEAVEAEIEARIEKGANWRLLMGAKYALIASANALIAEADYAHNLVMAYRVQMNGKVG